MMPSLHIQLPADRLIVTDLSMEGSMGRPRVYTDEQRREKRRLKYLKWRAANLERAREIGRESMKRAAAKRALAEGRVPGKKGPAKRFTEEQKRAKRKAKMLRWIEANKEVYLRKAREREQAKRDGTFVSRALPRLTDEQRRLVGVAMSAKRRARVRGVFGTHTRADIERLYELQEGICVFCNKPLGDDIHVDHWLPISLGGSNDRLNLRLLHEKCNLTKGAQHPSAFPLVQPTILVW